MNPEKNFAQVILNAMDGKNATRNSRDACQNRDFVLKTAIVLVGNYVIRLKIMYAEQRETGVEQMTIVKDGKFAKTPTVRLRQGIALQTMTALQERFVMKPEPTAVTKSYFFVWG